MSPVPPRVVLGLAFALLLAGCAGDPGSGTSVTFDPTSSEPAPTDDSSASPPSTTAPALSDEELEEYGVKPTEPTDPVCVPPESVVKVDLARNFEGAAHTHDEWNGQQEIVIFDDDVRYNTIVGSTPPPAGVAYGQGAGYFFTPGARVLGGTSKVIFQATWDDVIPGDGRRLFWQMPGDEAPSGSYYDHAFAASGDTFELAINLTNNDPPHVQRTEWAFYFVSTETSQKAPTHFTWTIQRGYECLPVDPPHYDPWNGADTLTLVDAEKSGTWRKVPGLTSGGLQVPPIPENNTIPVDTKLVRITLTWTEAQTNSKLGVRYCTPDSPCGSIGAVWKTASAFREEGAAKRVFEIPVEEKDWDSPYATRTQWLFQPFFDNGSASAALSDYGNFEGSAHWLIEAVR